MKERKYYHGSRDGKMPRSTKALDRAASHYDLIVIGSGLAGMTAANVLGKLGHRVCLLEQHYNFGGLATWFKRKGGHVFDISLHGFPVGMLKTCRRHWNQKISEAIVPLEGVRFDNPQFQFETAFTREDFTDKLVGVFALERAQVERFFAHLAQMSFYDDAGETTGELFERFFPGRNDVHRLLLEPIAYANGSTLSDPAISYGIVFTNFMRKGIWTFSGGTDQLVAEMRAELGRNGVELFNNVQVERILIDDRRVVGIEACGRRIGARSVVSNANIKHTIFGLAGEEHFDDDYLAAARAVRLNNSSAQVYIGIRRGESIPFVCDLLFTSTRPTFDSPALCDMRGQSRTFSFYYPKTRPGLERYTVVSSTNANYADWAELDEAAYEREKAHLIESTLIALEGYLPGVRDRIDHVEAATPRTFQFYTQHWRGASFGTKFEGLRTSMELPAQVEGLFHSGSVGIIMSGWLGAANYGVICANKVDEYLTSPVEAPA
jgi:phytoene dehydrogenase-like protein